jgi:uncharacterized protein (DUF934 family)
MSQLIVDGKVTTTDDREILTLEEFLVSSDKSTGVWLDAHEEVETLSDFIGKIPVIALNFPTFADGRAYSSANLLRRHYGFEGELRAIGDVRIDQFEQMARCGFNAFELADGQNAQRAIERMQGFAISYQLTIDRSPLFRQR